ncbi:MAG: hypothetical protein WC781_01305 [Candidatus Pacearchaeota archaeon]|jgi:hypothetical protein
MEDLKEKGLGDLVREVIKLEINKDHFPEMIKEEERKLDIKINQYYEEINRRDKALRETYKFY